MYKIHAGVDFQLPKKQGLSSAKLTSVDDVKYSSPLVKCGSFIDSPFRFLKGAPA